MNSTNPTLAKLRKLILITALVICPLLTAASGKAQTWSASLTNGVGGSSTFDITSGQSFVLTLNITTDFVTSGVTFFLVANDGSGYFQLTSRDVGSGPYPDPTSDDADVFGPGGALNPQNGFDLGYTNNGSATDPAGMYSVVSYTLSSTAPLGTYHISLSPNSIVTDRTGGGFTDRTISATATINVVPEPTTVALAVLGGGALLVAVWRKQRAQA